jgi:hypothetical protein
VSAHSGSGGGGEIRVLSRERCPTVALCPAHCLLGFGPPDVSAPLRSRGKRTERQIGRLVVVLSGRLRRCDSDARLHARKHQCGSTMRDGS